MTNKVKKVPASLTPTDDKKRVDVQVKVPKTENVIFIGSEMNYDSFWLKMMFVAAAYAKVKHLRFATKTTIAYVDNGYTRAEKLTLDNLHDKFGHEIVKITKLEDVITLLNKDRDECKLQDVAFFSHGIVGHIVLNYGTHGNTIPFGIDNFTAVRKDAFLSSGQIYSYACRTGVAVEDYKMGFKSEAEAHPENSLAQQMANHFGVEVHAFLRRSFYGNVMRSQSQSASISTTLKAERETKDGSIIDIPPDHEALPHSGLADSFNPLSGPKREGTDNYALWRKGGGLTLPSAADSPEGLPTEMRVFKAKK